MCPDGRSCLQADCSYCTVQFHLLTDMTAAKADTTHFFLRALEAHSDAGKHVHKLTHVYASRPTRCQSIQCHSHRQVTGCAVVCSQASSRCKVEEGACYWLSKKRLTLRRDRVMVVMCAGWHKQLYVYE